MELTFWIPLETSLHPFQGSRKKPTYLASLTNRDKGLIEETKFYFLQFWPFLEFIYNLISLIFFLASARQRPRHARQELKRIQPSTFLLPPIR